ncbi:AAA domain-containing protein [Sphaerisporangium sp. NPDC088356]|uniref:DEAD/DEAH box helicase n=1 Tax=Sphaerisporangium sp. NPDC088356 TaxID=3154871 RepID=UPI003428BFBA
MGIGLERKLVKVVENALSSGPMPQEALLATVQQAGLRVDAGVLWETCKTHGIADLRGESWVLRSSAVPDRGAIVPDGVSRERSNPDPIAVPHQRSQEEQDAAAEVGRLGSSLGIPAVEPVPPPGPVPGAWADAAEGASRAFGDELQAVSKRRTQTDVPLTMGTEAGRAGSRRMMRFEAQGEVGVAEGTPATLIVTDAQFEVEVVSVFGNVVTLSTPPDTPAASEATLRLDLSWLLIAQSRRLHELAHGGPGFDGSAALAVVTHQHQWGSAAPVELPEGTLEGLNNGQRSAVERALAPGLTWLWGPPGTGKTTTISALVAELCARGQRVLLAAPTNAALDVAIQALLKRLPDVDEGLLVRLGQPADSSLVDRNAGRILVDEIAAARGEPIAKRRVEVGRDIRQRRQELSSLKRRLGQLTSEEETRRLRVETQIAHLQALQRELDRKLLAVRRQVCREATVVAATAHQVVLETLKQLTFDVVILDEASMTSAALAMLVAGAGHGHTVIAGDFRQLPPIAVAATPPAQEWLKRSPFEKAGISTAVAKGCAPANLAALTEQYRMRRPIGDVVSTAFYPESPLVTARGVASRTVRSRAPWASSELVFIDTSSMRARTARRQGMLSRYNLMHAQLAAALVGSATSELHDLALITPFAPQARLLESLLPGTRFEDWAASTVHRFQGGERDIVIYDTVDTGHGVSPLHPWFTDGSAGSEGARLLNVAASRARDNLVVIGALNSLHRPGSARDAVWTFFAHLLDRAECLPWEKVLTLSAGVTEYVQNAVTQRLRNDIARAATVEMWLPRAPLHSLPALLKELRWMRNEDPDTEAVTIWVEPEPDGYLSAEALRARQEGINVRPLMPILESGAVIGDVVWSSSAPLLGPAPGVVLRTEHRAFADAIRRAQRRRPGVAPGSGQLGDDCGRCQRMLIRYETGRRGQPDLRYECHACDRLGRTTKGKASVRLNGRTAG